LSINSLIYFNLQVPYHEMAEVKDKFEKGLVDSNKPRTEKRLDVRVQSGLASSKKQAFEQGEFEQETESHISKVQIDADLVAGLASAKKHAFEQYQLENDNHQTRSVTIDRGAFAGAATDKKAKFEKGEFDQNYHESGSNRVQADAELLIGAATDKKAKFESGQMTDGASNTTRRDDILTIVENGLAQAKRSELLSKFDAEQQVQRSGDRHIDIDREQGLATSRRDQLEQLAQSEFKGTERHIDVTSGLANTIREQYIADTSKTSTTKSMAPSVTVESGLAKNRATAFENPDETTVRNRSFFAERCVSIYMRYMEQMG
jgi:ribosomal protein L19E